MGNRAKKIWADLQQNRWYVIKTGGDSDFLMCFCMSVYSLTRWVNSCCIWDAHRYGIHVSCQFMPLCVGPLDNRGELLADSRRNRWYDEKPGGSWTVQGVPGVERRERGKDERRRREGTLERRARAGGVLRRREAQNLLHVATNSCSNL